MTRRLGPRAAGLVALALLGLVDGAGATCSVSTTGVAFGTYDTLGRQVLDGAGTITVTCSPSASYAIALSSGGGTYAARRLAGGGVSLAYDLYTDAARTSVWGDGTGATVTVSGSGTSTSHTVYGRIPGGQNVPAGSYADSITVTLTF